MPVNQLPVQFRIVRVIAILVCFSVFALAVSAQQTVAQRTANSREACLDGFCIGQSIKDARFESVDWLTPHDGFTQTRCTGVGCKPEVAFRGYPPEYQKQLAEAFSWIYGLQDYNVITKSNLDVLRHYQYECNPSARGTFGERRIFGAYRSRPTEYLSVIGLRLIHGELRVYRIAREFPFHTQAELVSLAKTVREQYGGSVLLYENLSSNAYSDVIEQRKDGWFGRSTMFNPGDLSDNKAELVLIDPHTRPLLEPSSMPESGEIKPLPVVVVEQCSKSLPLQ